MSPDLTWTAEMTIAQKMVRYKAWANGITLDHLATLPEEEARKPRDTYFGSILQTLQHNVVVDEIFKAHVDGTAHGHASRKPEMPNSVQDVRTATEAMDAAWIAMIDAMPAEQLHRPIAFTFINGSAGIMSPCEMVLHLVNHSTYHRGFVDEILGQMKAEAPASDFPIYMRDMART